jgi:hypothetical protein
LCDARIERRHIHCAGRLDQHGVARLQQASASTNALRWMSGSPPVISTSGVPISSTRSMISSSDIFSPPWNEYSVSHQTQRSGQPVSRMNVHGSPAQVLSPWTEWKISVMRRNGGVAVVPPVWLMVPIPAVPGGPAIIAS